jgi:hypothetical protein
VWRDLPTGEDRWVGGLPDAASAVLPLGDALVVASGGRLLRIDSPGRAPSELARYEGVVTRAQAVAGRALLITRAQDGRGPWAGELFDIATGLTVGRWALARPPCCALAPDGASVAYVTTSHAVALCSPGREGERPALDAAVRDVTSLRWDDDHTVVVHARSGTQVWDVAEGRRVSARRALVVDSGVGELAIGRGAALHARPGALAVLRRLALDPARPEEVYTLAGTPEATLVAIDPEARWGVTAGARRVIAWDLRSATPARVAHLDLDADDQVAALAVVGARAFAVGSRRGAVLRVDVVEARR